MSNDSGSDARIRDGYAARAVEYTELLGDIGQMDAVDRARIGRWAEGVEGRILDAGCGPGHWTAFLVDRGVEASGIDLVPEFIVGASARFPHVPFRVASLDEADISPASFGGVLAWYSLIHASPDELPSLLAAARRALREGGRLLVGFFDGPDGEPFPHAVTTAHYWTIEGMSALLERAGFSVIDSDARVQDGRRPHASISAVAV
ncbi:MULTISPECIES: class I SAM-dependent methyltransferase [unclassified Microbacterium]|uniref:class I SAM-dependent methyltransferase n=1 Tax=unclassified Microbacterium TaxID=2609290 RepID=UPI000CFB3A6D|nr:MULTISPECIES: class I SAM-dependent methyltransferase [unclassified Microbacterium]PQZ60298.1 SAM-dependent methyltransferase [Microbacterium sp. MYb43]PQZ76935.1 SAM-dependent methyltransferase [Microbacterium sp. MYb40]PRB23341.1 SAM-dependent methyltransferase [Microbacterium sp. MYb54]PRB28236.1 SAM-dependent methyltransferase [Microbacterium sp. MYb50]PRB66287.1 SAM-dependent methyltransferase [Microbacterium sp. MYb24]